MQRLEFLLAVLQGRTAPVVSEAALQRPSFFIPGLRNRAWFEPHEFSWVPELEAKAPLIRNELASLRRSSEGHFRPYTQPDQVAPTLHDRGAWNVYYFHLVGKRFDDHCRACPITSSALESIPRLAWRAGLSCFSELTQGTHVTAHCGITNLTIRCHLGLFVPANCRMRVGDETRSWSEGKCSVFDDAFEHEVWHDGELSRIVLMFDLYHPDLTDDEVARLESLISSEAGQALAAPWLAMYREHEGG